MGNEWVAERWEVWWGRGGQITWTPISRLSFCPVIAEKKENQKVVKTIMIDL